jgi:hypothetical protein
MLSRSSASEIPAATTLTAWLEDRAERRLHDIPPRSSRDRAGRRRRLSRNGTGARASTSPSSGAARRVSTPPGLSSVRLSPAAINASPSLRIASSAGGVARERRSRRAAWLPASSRSPSAARILSTTCLYASSAFDHLLIGRPSCGTTWNFANGVRSQPSTARNITPITSASPRWARSTARSISCS